MLHPRSNRLAAAERVVAVGHRSNGFDLIRIIAAVMVLVGHTYALSHQADPGFLDNPISSIGVKIFFITSGFLVAKSWAADPSPLRFALRRLLRIMPGLIGVVVLTLLILGPFFSTYPWRVYLNDPRTWSYLWNIALFPVYSLPGVFTDNIYPLAVNGSLWSLPVEVLMYILLPPLFGWGGRAARFILPAVAGVACAAALYYVRIVPGTALPVFYGTAVAPLLEVSCYFAIGAVWAMFRWQRFARPALGLALLALAGWLIPRFLPFEVRSPVSEFALMVLLPFAIISCGLQRLKWFDRPGSWGDVSYGLYLYAFPVQQSVMALSHGRLDVFTVIAITLPVTAVCAALSWVCIERSALALKPGRRRSVARRPAFSEAGLNATVGVEPQTLRGDAR